MDDAPDDPPRHRRRRAVLLSAVLLVALLASLALEPDIRRRVQAAPDALGPWLLSARTTWPLPLAAALTFAALTSPPARRRWPRPTRRIWPAVGCFVVLVALALTTAARPRAVVLAVGVVVAVGLLAAWVLVVPRRLAPPLPAEMLDRLGGDRDRLEATAARLKLQNDLRTTALQAIAGLAVLAGAVLGFQQLTDDRRQATDTRELTLQGQASERFTRAINQLSSDRLEVQLGGIYGLEQIARQAPDNRLAVAEVLVAYLRRRIPRPAKSPPGPVEELRTRAPDAQAALTVLGRRKTVRDPHAKPDPALDLRALDLHLADLDDADLHGALLRDADLSGAFLDDADLHDAFLDGADLGGAFLDDADLRHANLPNADLGGAFLAGADLRDAVLFGANLTGARLAGADLTGARLADATADRNTTWPAGFDWQRAGVRLEASPGP